MNRITFIGDRSSDVHLLVADAGIKAVNLARLDRLGFNVPPAIVLSTGFSQMYRANGVLPPGFAVQLAAALRWLEDATGLTLGGRRPLLVSVRSSPVMAMPGMLHTLLNVGLNEQGVRHLVTATGNPWFAWDCYRRLVRGFGEMVHHVDPGAFDRLTTSHLARGSARVLQDLDPLAMRELARASADALQARAHPLPDNPMEQLLRSVEAVFASCESARAREYRRVSGIQEGAGTGVIIQAMVFGNAGAGSGSGVGFTRNPSTGDDELYVDFVYNGQGDDVAAARAAVQRDGASLSDVLPRTWAELQKARPVLEREFGDMQDFEFTVDDGRLFFLQTKDGKRTPWAAVRIAVDLVRRGIMNETTALQRLSAYDLTAIARRTVHPSCGPPLARAVPASTGVATGAIVFDSARAQQRAGEQSVILVRPEIAASDVAGIAVASGLLTASGGRTSHAAVIARELGKACIVGCSDLRVDQAARTCMLGPRVLHEGDILTLDGSSGLVFGGFAEVAVDRPDEALSVIESWRRHSPPLWMDGQPEDAPVAQVSDAT